MTDIHNAANDGVVTSIALGGSVYDSATVASVNAAAKPSGSVTFTFDGSTPLECRVDAQAWEPCTDAYTAPELSDGGHVFRVRNGADSKRLQRMRHWSERGLGIVAG